MDTRPLVLTGLALVGLAGCQSYFPNGYGAGGYGAGAYPNYPPPGSYAPPTGAVPQTHGVPPSTTYQQGRSMPPNGGVTTQAPPLNNDNKYVPNAGQKPVPNYKDPGNAPATLGAPLDDEESIRRPTSQRSSAPAGLGSLTDESEEHLAAFGDDEFAAPQRIDPASATAAAIDDGDDMPPRQVRKPPRDLFRHDAQGYTWLRGVVVRDPQGNGWRLQYGDESITNDRFDGMLTLVGNDKIDNLREDDTIKVQGRVDLNTKDRYGKPVYRVEALDWVKRRD